MIYKPRALVYVERAHGVAREIAENGRFAQANRNEIIVVEYHGERQRRVHVRVLFLVDYGNVHKYERNVVVHVDTRAFLLVERGFEHILGNARLGTHLLDFEVGRVFEVNPHARRNGIALDKLAFPAFHCINIQHKRFYNGPTAPACFERTRIIFYNFRRYCPLCPPQRV